MSNFLAFGAVGLGGLIGSLARYILTGVVGTRFGFAFPWGTLAVNVLGCLAVGFLGTMWVDRGSPPMWRLLVGTGFLGGFTTFSSYGFETLQLVRRQSYLEAALYASGSVVLGLAAVFAGFLVARGLRL